MDNIVYSTNPDLMKKCNRCGNLMNNCSCSEQVDEKLNDKPVLIGIEKKGRAGKSVTTILNIKGDKKHLLRELQRELGTGGTVKNGIIEIRGSRRNEVADLLNRKGISTKFSGG